MTLSDVAEFGKVFGLPGLFLLCWFLLERDKNKRNERIEGEKVAVEREKAVAMTAGFTSLSGKIDAHQIADINSHKELATEVASLHSRIDTIADLTPVRGIQRIEPQGGYGPSRPKTGGR